MGIFAVNYDGISPMTNHEAWAHVKGVDALAEQEVLDRLGPDLMENVLKVGAQGIYVAGIEAANKIYSDHYMQSKQPARDLSSAGHIVVPFRQAAAPVMRPARTMGFAPAMAA